MTKNIHSSKAFASEALIKVVSRTERSRLDRPVALEAFEREHMGIAAKE